MKKLQKTTAPKPDAADNAQTIIKAGISLIPIVGGSLSELLNIVVTPSLQKRQFEWMKQVDEVINEITKRGITIEDLAENEKFVDLVLAASKIAISTSQQEKIEALKNAIYNTATSDLDIELQQFFLTLINTLGVLHLKILGLFNNPASWFKNHDITWPNVLTAGLTMITERGIPELRNRKEFYLQLWKDLYMRGLINTENMNTIISEIGLKEKRTTNLGEKFIEFITKK